MSQEQMLGVVMKGSRQLELGQHPIPEPGHGQVLLKMQASSLCGSDLRCLYRVDTDKIIREGSEGYKGVISGHEPCGQIAKVGPNVKGDWAAGDRAIVYHISGCLNCRACKFGLYISCSNHDQRQAYGWQRSGGSGEYILAEAHDLVKLPEPLTYIDGSMIACGMATAYAATLRAEISGRDVVVITGMGPVGVGAAMLAQKEGAKVYGLEIDEYRRNFAKSLGIDTFWAETADEIKQYIGEDLGPSVVIDCSGNPSARHTGLEIAREWGRVIFVGEGNTVSFDVSHLVIHKSLTIRGSWVSSIGEMTDLVELLVRWNLSCETMVTHVYTLDQAKEAYELFDTGKSGKVVLCSKEEAERFNSKKN